MSRRTGPGGRLRPSPRTHRPGPRDVRHIAGQPRPDATSRPTVAVPADAPPPGPPDDSPASLDLAAPDAAGLERLDAAARPVPVEQLAAEPLADADLDTPDADTLDEIAVPRSVEAVPDVAGARPSGGRPQDNQRSRGGARPDRPDRPEQPEAPGVESGANRSTCTSPQLRRFIKSRAYVPMHELRRRFSINGEDDEVCPIELEAGRIYVGLPAAEGRMLGDLVRNGEVGYELSMDPETPIVIGVYSMRPITRS